MRLRRSHFLLFSLGVIAITGLIILVVFKQTSNVRESIATGEESFAIPIATTLVFDRDVAPSSSDNSKVAGSGMSAPAVAASSRSDSGPTPLMENSQSEAKAPPIQPRGTHISHGGPLGTMEMTDPPERLPSTDESPEEVIVFDNIRTTMPRAYLVKKASGPPSELVTEIPSE